MTIKNQESKNKNQENKNQVKPQKLQTLNGQELDLIVGGGGAYGVGGLLSAIGR